MVEGQFSLLIIDSFTSLFRVEFLGREELAPRQQAIASMMNKLTKIASEFNVAVLITKYVPHTSMSRFRQWTRNFHMVFTRTPRLIGTLH